MKQSVLAMLLMIGLVILCKVLMEPKPKQENEESPIENYDGEIIKKKVERTDSVLKEQVQQLELKNDSLKKEVEKTRISLKESRVKVFRLQEKVTYLAEASSNETDTILKLVYCEDLQEQVKDLVAQSKVEDSLSNEMIFRLEEEAGNLRSMVSVYEKGYSELKIALDQSLKQQDILNLKLDYTESKLKKVQRRNRFLGAGLVFLTGMATTIAIQMKP